MRPASPPTDRAPSDRRPIPISRALGLALGCGGLALLIAGSFLPWVQSGSVLRNSYEISAIADRFAVLGAGAAGTVLALWPLFGPVCFVPVITALLRWWRATGILAVVIGLGVAILAAAILLAGRGRTVAGISLISTGPGIMLAGALLLILSGVLLLGSSVSVRARRRSRTFG